MWESNRTKVIIGNILLFLAIVAIVAGLVYAMFRIREINRVQDEELTELYIQQKQVQNEQRQEPTVSIQAEYEKDLATIEEYMPGIVCWGDGTTAAASVSLNYPYVLQTYIDTYICDIYDFSSTIENAAELPRFNWDDYKVSIPVVNMGAGKESTYTILGRAGVIPYVVGAELVIPADTESVPITLWSAVSDYTYVTPLTGGDFGVNPVVIDGIEGRLSINSEDYNYNGTLNYFFTRSTPGEEKSIPAGTVVTTAGTNMYKDYIHVILMGVYGEYQGADDLVQQTKALVERQVKNSERFIVLGPYINAKYGASTFELDAIDSAMLQAFGNRYISIRKYLAGDGYADAGITPTNEDKYYISQNIVPPSFKVSSYSEELNSRAHKLIGKLVFNRMQSLGYFDEINDELNISETTKRILKDDPSYFERIISNVLN
ncbi:hypothetical protein [uncultured Ruminococcus sp.]|uniref:hypothetical protein n=1 Tax=uncultured Ruminococcus sp. TaxID=165186 RepID=UPI00292DAE8C|nr:hypothetical protein [uncultured Ruminococcus sp.]